MSSTRSTTLSAQSSAPSAAFPVRLTRRGRVAVVLLVLLAAFLTASLVRTSSSEAGTAPTGSPTRYVTVQSGETLWQIAQRVAPGQDVRDAVDRIRELNALDTTVVQAGQRLVVPFRG